MSLTKKQITLQQECSSFIESFLLDKDFVRRGSYIGCSPGEQNTFWFEKTNQNNTLSRVQVSLGFQRLHSDEEVFCIIKVQKGTIDSLYEKYNAVDYISSMDEFKSIINRTSCF